MFFQLGTELGEASGELPVAIYRGMVQRTWFACQGRKVVEWIEDQGTALCDRMWVATTWPPATITTRST